MAEHKTHEQVRDEHVEVLGPILGPLYRIRQTKDTFQAGHVFDAVVAWTNNENGEGAGEPARKPTE